MPANPAIYNDIKLAIPISDIYSAYNIIYGASGDVATSIQNIIDAISGIPWDGSAAQDMQTVTDQWQSAIDNLLGTNGDPSKGVLNKVVSQLDTVANSFQSVDQSLQTAFQQMMDNPNDHGDQNAPPQSTDLGDLNSPNSFIAELYPDASTLSSLADTAPAAGPTNG